MAYRWTEEDVQAIRNRERRLVNGTSCGKTDVTMPKKKQAKYLNRKTTDLQGVVHDGKGESERWQDLTLLERAGGISQLRRQVPFALVVNGILVCSYIADFVYVEGAATVVEDHKSPRTRKLESFRHKVKLMQALYGLQVREVTK